MTKLLIELHDGRLERKPREALEPTDKVVFDGPDAFASTDHLQKQLEAEIDAAGGLEAWRAARHHRLIA